MSARLALTVREAADLARVSPDTIKRAIHATSSAQFPPPLRAKRAGRGFLILTDDLHVWLDSLPDA